MPEIAIPWEITNPYGERAVFNDQSDPDFIGLLDPENGITGLYEGDVREEADVLTEEDGGIHGDFFRGRMAIVFNGNVWMNDGIEAQNFYEDKVRAVFNRCLRADGVVKFTPSGQNERLFTFRSQQPVKITGRRPKVVTAQIVSATHRVVSSAEHSLNFLAGTGTGELGFSSPLISPLTSAFNTSGAVQVVNEGKDDWPPRFRIDGPITNPRIMNNTTGEEIKLTLTVPGGEYVLLDVADQSVVQYPGVVDRYSAVQFPGSQWWKVMPGNNDVRLLATSYSSPAGLTVYWRDAWS